MPKIFTPLEIDEAKALVRLSLREKRDPRQQAALLIRTELERLGLLPAAQPTGHPAPVKAGRNE